MSSERGYLNVGSLYRLHDQNGYEVQCLGIITNAYYSPFCARVRSIRSGWTMDVMGTNVYEDGSIDWDFSINGYFTEYDNNGILKPAVMGRC